ncbi:hypothetical protein FIV42_15390 [Persicimonas caeni]|uniref:Uncharacterized protein n=1 Tax=Persicimonas caeni TaxID=2292766 RepID=A0A4Y6PUQ9_PERCE|nr:hypothetical protein [Persicimonas caeni]QDG52076.1 hypothetical protein FIV42_15390 [Persicimonas caeni]QED33297.1 hypothetical protein FRD00_15385 [Persicimonas caeni]
MLIDVMTKDRHEAYEAWQRTDDLPRMVVIMKERGKMPEPPDSFEKLREMHEECVRMVEECGRTIEENMRRLQGVPEPHPLDAPNE